MVSFDLYYHFAHSRRDGLNFVRSFEQGTEVRLDGIDGFDDQYFQGPETQPGRRIRFAVIAGGHAVMPDEAAAVERLPLVEALVTAHPYQNPDWADVLIERVQPLGAWAGTVALSDADTLSNVPADLRPDDALLDAMCGELIHNSRVLHHYERRRWSLKDSWDHRTGVCLFRVGDEVRALLLMDNAVPSHLVRL